jgi:hypothetical protein
MIADAHKQRLVEAWLDPFQFIRICWPEIRIFDKQRDILHSIRDNAQTFVHAAKEVGKTFVAALAAVHFFASRSPCRVVLFSASQDQLNNALWPELKQLIQTSRVDFGFRVVEHAVTKYTDDSRREVSTMDRMVAHVTTKAERYQGVHLPFDIPRVLAVFDEASAVDDIFLEAAESFAHRILVIGNPMSNLNFFYRCCKGGDIESPADDGLLRRVMKLTAWDSPNVQAGMALAARGLSTKRDAQLIPGLLTYEELKQREALWDDVKQTVGLRGEFYEGEQQLLYPAAWLDHAMDAKRWERLNRQERRVEAMGIDTAQGGRDRTVWTLIDRHGVIEQISTKIGNPVEIAKRTDALVRRHNLTPGRVAIDFGGGGKEVAAFLKEGWYDFDGDEGKVQRTRRAGYNIRVVNFGESPGADDSGKGGGKKKRTAWMPSDPSKSYNKRRAEMYGEFRKAMRPDQSGEREPFMIGPHWELRKELQVMPLLYDGEGKMFLPPKDHKSDDQRKQGVVTIKQLLGRSPDLADSLVLAYHALRHGRGLPTLMDPASIRVDGEFTRTMQKKIADGVEEMRRRMAAQ